MKLHFLLGTCLLLATFLDSPVDSKSIDMAESDGAGPQKHSDLGRLIGGTPVDKASKFGSDEHHQTAKNATQSDSTSQPPAANQYGASNGANVYGTQNTYGAGATYGSNQPLYGNQNGANFAPSGYLYNGGAYGANPCGCNQFAQGGAYPQRYSVQGPKLQRNQDAIGGGQGNRYNQGYSVTPPYARYPTFNVQYSQPPVYPAPVMGYGYPQYNPYYPYTYPYGYYGYPPYGQHHYHHKPSQQKQRSARHDKKHRVKKQRSGKHRDREERNWRKQE